MLFWFILLYSQGFSCASSRAMKKGLPAQGHLSTRRTRGSPPAPLSNTSPPFPAFPEFFLSQGDEQSKNAYFSVQLEETLLEITLFQDVRAPQNSLQGFYKGEVQFPSAHFIRFFTVKILKNKCSAIKLPSCRFYPKTSFILYFLGGFCNRWSHTTEAAAFAEGRKAG